MDGRVSQPHYKSGMSVLTVPSIMGMKYYIRQYTGLPYPDPDDAAAVAAFVLPGWQQSLLTGILSCGTFFGAIVAGDIADRIGRRWTIITGCCIFSVGCICQTASTTLALMVVGRLIAGLGVGFISAISKLSLPIRLAYVRSPITYIFSVSHSLHVRNRTQESSRRSRRRLPILYHHRYPHGQLRRVRHPKSR